MSIRVQDLYKSKLRVFGMGASSTVFEEQFIDSMNKVLSDLEVYALTGEITVAGTGDDISLDAKFYTAISDGLDLYIQDANNFAIKDRRDVERRYFDKLKTLQVDFFEDSSNEVYAKLGDL